MLYKLFCMTQKNSLFPLAIAGMLVTAFLSNDSFLPSLPAITEQFRVSDNLAQTTLTAWFMGAAVSQVMVGFLSEFYGRKPVILSSLLLLALASLLCIAATHINLLIFGRGLQGLGVGGMISMAFTSTHEVYAKTSEKGTKSSGYIWMSATLSPFLGPPLGAYLLEHFGLHASFYMIIFFSCFLLFIFAFFIPETHKIPQKNLLNKKLILKIFKIYRPLLAKNGLICILLIYGFISFVLNAFYTSSPFIFIDLLGLTPQKMGIILMVFPGMSMLGNFLTTVASKKISDKKIILLALIVCALTILSFALTTLFIAPSLLLVILHFGICSLCTGFAIPAITNLVLIYAKSAKGVGSSLLVLNLMIGATLGSSAVAMLYNETVFIVAIIMGGAIFPAFFYYLCCFKRIKD